MPKTATSHTIDGGSSVVTLPAETGSTPDLGWHRRVLVSAYEERGRRDPRWDLAAITGLEYLAREAANDPTRPPDSNDQAWHWLRHAVALGSDDPLVLFLAAQLSVDDDDPAVATHRLRTAALKLERSRYPALWRQYGFNPTGDTTVPGAKRTMALRHASAATGCDATPYYESLLAEYPDAVTARGEYARLLIECERWADARAQFEILTPDRVRAGVFGGRAAYDGMRQLAALKSSAR